MGWYLQGVLSFVLIGRFGLVLAGCSQFCTDREIWVGMMGSLGFVLMGSLGFVLMGSLGFVLMGSLGLVLLGCS